MSIDRISWALVAVGFVVLLLGMGGCSYAVWDVAMTQGVGTDEEIEKASRTYALWLRLFMLSPAVMFVGAVLRAVTPPKKRIDQGNAPTEGKHGC